MSLTQLENDAAIDREQRERRAEEEMQRDRRVGRKTRWRFGCAAAIIIVTMLMLFFTLAAVAKTGIVGVPGLTAWLFHPVSPSREVRPVAGFGAQAVVQNAAYAAKFDPSTRLVTIRLTEEDLTTIFFAALASQSGRSLRVERAQVAVAPGAIEAFAAFSVGSRRTAALVALSPAYENGMLRLHASRVVIGSLELPKVAVTFLEKRAEDRIEKAYRQSSAAIGEIASIDVGRGAISVSFIPADK